MFKQILFCISLLTLLAPHSTFAASSGTLTVSGVVATINDIVITPNGSYNTSLNITDGEYARNIASVAETSNDVLGYKIFMSSTNGGTLNNSIDATKSTAYAISYDGAAYTTPSTYPTQVKNISALNALTTNTSQVLINVVAYPDAVAGTYSDTVLFSIVAN